MFYEGLRLWEAHLYVFYVSGRLSGGSVSNDASGEGGAGCFAGRGSESDGWAGVGIYYNTLEKFVELCGP